MPTLTMEELIAQFPPVTPHRLCNPLFCKNRNLKTPNLAKAIEIESVLLKVLQEHRLNCIVGMISISRQNDDVPRLLGNLSANSMNSNIHSIENKRVLEKFKIDLKNAVVAAMRFSKEQGWDCFISANICRMSRALTAGLGSICLCAAAESGKLKGFQSYYEDRETNPELRIRDLVKIISQHAAAFSEYHSQMKEVKKWNEREIKKYTFDVSSIIRNVFQAVLEGHDAMVYFKAYDKLVGGVAMLEYGRLLNENAINYPSSVLTIPFSVEATLETCLSTMQNSALLPPSLRSLSGWLNARKELADKYASEKIYADSIILYTELNTLPTIDSLVKLNSLTNCAAIRLRVSDTKPWQLSYAIMECTFALEIDPNHGKALFRRGLALALLKKWDEAIVDFQRAVELDPRSPAAKELAVALRQVGRRIEA